MQLARLVFGRSRCGSILAKYSPFSIYLSSLLPIH